MSLSHLEIQKLLDELKPQLERRKIQQVYQPNPECLLLVFQKALLLIDCHPGTTRIHLIEDKMPQPANPYSFTQFLRKYIKNKKLDQIDFYSPTDRIIELSIPPYLLIAELFGNRGNIYLTDRNKKILRSLKKTEENQGHIYNPILSKTTPSPKERDFKGEGLLSFRIAQFYENQKEQQGEEKWKKAYEKKIQQQEKKIERLRREVQEGQKAGLLLQAAETIKSNLHLDPTELFPLLEATLSKEISSTIDSKKPPLWNMNQLFSKYKKLKRKEQSATKRMEIEQKHLRQLHNQDLYKLREIYEKKEIKEKEAFKLPTGTLFFTSPDDYTVLVGKSAMGNENLLKFAKGNDLWLHASGTSGAHVLICQKGRTDVPQRTIYFAARLALRHSRMRNEKGGEVYLSKRTDVRRVKGRKPGQVTLQRSEILYVKYSD
jgi:predicted ribosome quality control (RQC) complex YloA/Tae2 family protein